MTLSTPERNWLRTCVGDATVADGVEDEMDGTRAKTFAAGATIASTAMVGSTTSSYVGFYGSGPVQQRASSAQAAVATTAATTSTPFGFAQSQADAIVTLVNELRAAMVAAGLIKGSA